MGDSMNSRFSPFIVNDLVNFAKDTLPWMRAQGLEKTDEELIEIMIKLKQEYPENSLLKFRELHTVSKLDPKKSKEGKLPLNSPALHPEFCNPLVLVAEMSREKKYEPLNWLDEDSTVTLSYLDGAIMRHLQKAMMGFNKNTEEKTLEGNPTKNQPYHYACVAYNALMACMLLDQKGDKIDDHLFKDGRKK